MTTPKIESLDVLIAHKAAEFADQIRAAAVMADKEEEIRIATEKELAFIQKEAHVKLEGKHEFTVASGRIDSVYDRVIIEYKNPKSPGARIGPKPDSPGTKAVVEQIKKRFYDMRTEHRQQLNSLFGVGLDGNHFVFVRYRDDKWQVQEPVEVSRYSAERFLWALFNLGRKGKSYSPDYLAGDFGADAPVAKEGVRALYGAIRDTVHPRAQTFFSQWKILFGEVCGYDVSEPSDKIRKLAASYGIPSDGLGPAELLFALHSYYALFMKLLASEVVAFFHKLPTPLQKMIQAGTSETLRREMEDLEAGSIFRHLGISNFLEGDMFAWYTAVWSQPIESLVRDMVSRLDNYNPGTLSEDPAGSRDLLKKLYQQLFPKTVRHDLGEYYTPDWLAELVPTEVGYDGDPDKRLLDPACGSGTFLVMAINRIRQWYDDNRESCRYDEGELCRKMLANVRGFDLNPLAVMAARTNYLVAIRDLVGRVDSVEIPVYLCDSILTPSGSQGRMVTTKGRAIAAGARVRELKTAAGAFYIPEEIADDQQKVNRYTKLLEDSVKIGRLRSEFLQAVRDDQLPVVDEVVHSDLYDELVELHRADKNRLWARIIKNAFAPIFSGRFDFVVGNPPWVRWGYLPAQYRTDIKFLWRRYGLFTQKGLESKMGTAEADLSILFAYACLDYYLRDLGSFGFLITQEAVRSKTGNEGFRSFVLAPSQIPLRVDKFHDLVAVKPFEAGNKTAAIFITKGVQNGYPVPYTEWTVQSGESVSSDDQLDVVLAKTTRADKLAKPLTDPRSPWQVVAAGTEQALTRLTGPSAYRGRCGVSIDPYGVFLCRVVSVQTKGDVIVCNEPSLGSSVVPQRPPTKIESERVFPVVRGRDIRRWTAVPVYAGIILNSSTKKSDIPDEADARRRFPLCYSYLLEMRDEATKREKFWQFFSRPVTSGRELDPAQVRALGRYARYVGRTEEGAFAYEVADGPFYALFNVGTYTFSRFKVCWPMGASSMRAAVVGEYSFNVQGVSTARKPVVPATGTTSYVAFDAEDEAHFLCALLNSTPADAYIRSFSSAGRGFGAPSIVSKMRLPRFDRESKLHTDISAVSRRCHATAAEGDAASLSSLELENDRLAASLWGIEETELRTLQSDLSVKPRKRKAPLSGEV